MKTIVFAQQKLSSAENPGVHITLQLTESLAKIHGWEIFAQGGWLQMILKNV